MARPMRQFQVGRRKESVSSEPTDHLVLEMDMISSYWCGCVIRRVRLGDDIEQALDRAADALAGFVGAVLNLFADRPGPRRAIA